MSRYLKTPARWYKGFVNGRRAAEADDDYVAAGLIERKQLLEQEYLVDSIKLLRRFVKGYEARDGYDLRKIPLISDHKIQSIKYYASLLRQETARTFVDSSGIKRDAFKVVYPRTQSGRRAMVQFTGQRDIPHRKGYVVPIDDPSRQRVRLVKKIVITKDVLGRKRKVSEEAVEITQQRGGVTVYERYFRLPESAQTFDDVIEMTKRMLPFMPRGYYVIETSNHGAIHASIFKNSILQELRDRFLVYDSFTPMRGAKDSRALAETVIGYRLVGTKVGDADREYIERSTRRIQSKKFRQSQRAKQRRKILRKLKGI